MRTISEVIVGGQTKSAKMVKKNNEKLIFEKCYALTVEIIDGPVG